jgi:cytochrome c oxidase cbb3-type subunit 3
MTALAACLLALACKREERDFRPEPARLSLTAPSEAQGDLVPANTPPNTVTSTVGGGNPYEGVAFGISEGQFLFDSYNCSGCHARGAGGMGPPLIKDKWIYGVEPEKLFETISKGRPDGMPAWGSKVPEYQIWQLVTFVRSMNGLEPKSATPVRSDHLQQSLRERPLQ